MNAIHQFTLTAFRNHSLFCAEPEGRSVIITGPNGAGKTNILEAISLLSPGRGLRRAKLGEMILASSSRGLTAGPHAMVEDLALKPRDDDGAWVIAAQCIGLQGEVQIGTGLDVDAKTDRRLIRIDGKNASQTALSNHLAILWQTPQMDGLFLDSGTARRAFLDRLVYSVDSSHAARVSSYEQAMRERNRLLADNIRDDSWLNVLESRMAEQGTAIAAARLDTLARLDAAMQVTRTSFPAALLTVDGSVENMLKTGISASDAESQFAHDLRHFRARDAGAGRTLAGIHRSVLTAWHRGKNREAATCSTGEQKALLLSILLAQARSRADWLGAAPILLLDEVVAHLDSTRRDELFEEIEALKAQAWLTGTDAVDFSRACGNYIEIMLNLEN